MKRVFALLLALTMVLGLTPAALAANRQISAENVVEAVELPGVSRVEKTRAEENAPLYNDNEIVTVIVQMEEAAVIDCRPVSLFQAGGGISAGEALSDFLTSDEAQEISETLKRGQEQVLAQIGGVRVMGGSTASGVEVVAQWTNLINAMAIRVPYGSLEEIKAMDGVKNAYVQAVYSLPETPATQAGNAGYSYDLVGISSVWEAGYTGEGMVVAVLDTGLDLEWATYWDSETGANVTGIRRTHEAFTGDSFKTEEGKANVRLTEEELKSIIDNNQLVINTGADGQRVDYDGYPMYKNLKVPFAADYADGDMNVWSESCEHGTHVSGTTVGYAESEDGAVLFAGVAPDAQLLSMKVFTDAEGTAPEHAILSALEDAAVLGADVVNLSLGSNNGYAEDDSVTGEAYDRLYESGILFMTSAGNSYYSSMYSNYGDYALAEDPEISMLSAPSTYASNLSVAASNNTVTATSYMTWTDVDGTTHDIQYLDPNDVAWKYMFAGEENLSVNIIPVDGYGTYNDYYNAGFRGYYGYGDKGVSGIALVKRGGGLTFEEKINQATSFMWSYYNSALGYYVTEYPVKAVLIYDEDAASTELIYMGVDGALVTSSFISGVDGAALAEAAKAAMAAGSYVTLTNVENQDRITAWESAGTISEFSSWGSGACLELKPEITAPGGNIWSSLPDSAYSAGSGGYADYTGSYGMMSGTSMSAPHMSGITALVKQYLMEGQGMTSAEAASVADKLMVSTARPMVDPNGVYYSPRVQGAGLVDAAAAVTAPAYITVNGGIGKLELKDDPQKTGTYDLTFTVHNLSDEAITYTASATLLRPATETQGEDILMTIYDVLLGSYALGTVSVPANGETTVSFSVSLSADQKAELDRLFANGTYVEGFVTLTNGTHPDIGLPLLAFYGDWTAAPIFDRATWLDEPEVEGENFSVNECTWNPSVMGYFDGYAFYNLGQNPFDPYYAENQLRYYEENITIAPNGLFRSINDVELYQLRDAKVVAVEVKDKETGVLYYRDYAVSQAKTYYNSSYGVPMPTSVFYFTNSTFDGTDLEGNVLPNGTQCVMTITAYGDGDYPMCYDEELGYVVTDVEAVIPGENEPTFNGHEMDLTGDVVEFDVMVDTEAPKLVNNTVSVYEEDGRVYMTGTFEDGVGSMASVEIVPMVKRTYNTTSNPYADPNYYEYGLDEINPFYSELIYDKDIHSWTFVADITEYAHVNESYYGENRSYNYEWTGAVYVFGGDYGGNDRAYAVQAGEGSTAEGLILSQTSALLYVGESMELSVIDNTNSDEPVLRTSSDPEVATIDEFGMITAVAPGQAVITVSCGNAEAVCVVAVREHTTEVLDFDLSIEHFPGLTPDGTITVNVVNLQPADVVIEEVRWTVYEDDPAWAGLLNVSKDAQTGLSGRIALNYSLYGEDEPSAGSGYLDVTINGVTRTMTFDWTDLYGDTTEDGLISDSYYAEQTIYVTQGETATLIAKYRQNHSFIPVELYTLEGYTSYSSSNPTTPGVGLVLDGPNFATNGAEWRGRLVALEGYTLPSDIKVCTRYDYGYESEMYRDSYYSGFTYDASTGEIVVKSAPYGATNTLVIRADGIPTEGAPAGELSGVTYTRPDATYGPFDWAVTEGYELTGELTTAENVQIDYYNTKNVAYYTPDQPGVSYITAASKDGSYSVSFAVICEGVKAETLDLESHTLLMTEGHSAVAPVSFAPVPTLAEDQELIWTSFDESVVTVDENGILTAVAPGYAYVLIQSKTNTDVFTYLVVEVVAAPVYTVSFDSMGGSPVAAQKVKEGHAAAKPYDPFRVYSQFDGWYVDEACTIAYNFAAPVTADLVLYAGWIEVGAPVPTVPIIPTPTPTPTPGEAPGEPVQPDEPSVSFVDVTAGDWEYDYVMFVAEQGLFNGVDADHFNPDGSMTRAMLVTVLWRMAGEPAAVHTGVFSDVADKQWYTAAVEWAAAEGIVNGVSEDLFAPDACVTREQIAAILWRMEGKPAFVGDLANFPDGDSVSSYAAQAMAWAVSRGLFKGDSSGRLNPGATATRAEVATLICRYLDV